MNWEDVRLFLTIAEEGSFRQAAGKLNLNHSTLSRRIEALEFGLGAKLFNRQSTGLAPTPAGKEMLRTAAQVRNDFDSLNTRLFGQEKIPQGRIRMTVPSLIYNTLLLEPINEFCMTWPNIKIEVDNSLDLLNLYSREADMAIRMTNGPDEQLMGHKVGCYCEAAYATREYLETFQATGKRCHQWISPGSGYEFVAEFKEPFASKFSPEVKITLPDIGSQLLAAEMSMGMVMLPVLLADTRPSLHRLSNVVHRTDIWLLAHRDTRGNKRMKLFREFLSDIFSQNQNQMLGA